MGTRQCTRHQHVLAVRQRCHVRVRRVGGKGNYRAVVRMEASRYEGWIERKRRCSGEEDEERDEGENGKGAVDRTELIY